MKFKKTLIGLVAAAALAGLAYAQVSLPKIQNGSLIQGTALIQVLPQGQPSAQNFYVSPNQLAGTFGYYKSAASSPAAAFAYTFGANVIYASFTPSGTIASGYVTLPAAPNDGQRACVFTTQTITAFYVAANSGQSITNAGGFSSGVTSTALSANSGACWLYGSSNTTWDRD